MKIVVLDGYTLCPDDLSMDALGQLGEVAFYDRTPQEEIAQHIGDAPVVLTNKARITREVMDACPQLRYIGVLATGYNVVDIPAAKERGIVVTNVPAYSTQAVAQHTMALLLASLMTAACVSCLGIIGFVGVICPHVAKRLLGQDHRVSIPASALMGSLLLLCADALSRSLGSGSALPVGAITSLLGAPFFLAIIFSRKEHGQC